MTKMMPWVFWKSTPPQSVRKQFFPEGHRLTMPPEGPDLVLSSDIPNGEGNVLVLDRFDVETNGRDGSDDFSQFKLVKDGGLACSVQAHH
jgi:hypothetical protein